jgi:phage portal protein BeeE
VGAITYGAQQLGLAIEVQNFSATNFENKGVRQGYFTQKAIEREKKIIAGLEEAMAEKSVDRLAVLDEGLKFHIQSLKIIETQTFSIEEVARMFNIAPHKIKSLNSRPIIISSSKHSIMLQISSHLSQT